MLRTFSDNPTCRHIVFGGCHDSGYLNNLDQFKHNEAKASRITLLETTPAYPEFTYLPNFKRVKFDDVFRNEPLPDSAPAPAVNTSVAAAQSPPQSAQSPLVIRSLTNSSKTSKTPPGRSVVPAVLSPSPSPSTPAPSVSATESSEDSNWASVSKIGPQRTESISIAPSNSNTKKKYAYYNKREQRLDEPLPARDKASAGALDARMKRYGKKMCNNFHLGGSCVQGKFCQFQHEPRLSPGELVALRYKARSLACNNRYCEDIDCCESLASKL